MRARPVELVALALCLLLATPGCGAFSREPGRLLEQARAALKEEQYETAYGHLAEIRRRFPDRPESAEAFPLAIHAFHKLWKKNRWVNPDSRWVRSEPQAMFDWLSSFFGDGEAPQEQLDILFVGMRPAFYDAFPEYARTHPVLSRWSFELVFDDWKIVKVTASRAAELAQAAAAAR